MGGGKTGARPADACYTHTCHDLMLAKLWARRPVSRGFLVHNSALFDGVDER